MITDYQVGRILTFYGAPIVSNIQKVAQCPKGILRWINITGSAGMGAATANNIYRAQVFVSDVQDYGASADSPSVLAIVPIVFACITATGMTWHPFFQRFPLTYQTFEGQPLYVNFLSPFAISVDAYVQLGFQL